MAPAAAGCSGVASVFDACLEDLVESLPQDLERLGSRGLHRGLEISILLGAALGPTEAGAPLPDESGCLPLSLRAL